MFNNSSIPVLPNVFKEELKLYVHNVNHVLWYIQVMICVYGLLGNLLALIVINQKSLRNTSSAVFITYMAIFDSAVLVFHAVNLSKPPQYLYLLCFLTFLTDLSIFCAHWVLVIITLGNNYRSKSIKTPPCFFFFPLERCVAVYSPFLAKRFCTIHSARRSMYLLLTIAIVLFSIAFPFLYEIKGLSSHEKCRIRKQARRFHRIFQPILFIAIPDILLLSNLFTVYALCRRRQRLSLSYVSNGEKIQMRISDVNSNRKQRQLTIMLVTVSLSFYLFTTPAMIVFIKELRPPKHKVLEKVKRDFLIAQLSVVLSELNNAVSLISISTISMLIFFLLDKFYLLLFYWSTISSCIKRSYA